MRRSIVPLVVAILAAAPLAAQQSAPAPTPPSAGQSSQTAPPAPAPAPPRTPSVSGVGVTTVPSSTNIRLDIQFTDTLSGTPTQKTVSMVLQTGTAGMIRTYNQARQATLNVDAITTGYNNGLVATRVTFEYAPPAISDDGRNLPRPPSLNESITIVLQDGVPLMVAQSADPATDRKVTLELKATILK